MGIYAWLEYYALCVGVSLQAVIWLATIGFSLLFGTMLAKTWRVYYIFRSIKLKKKVFYHPSLVIMSTLMCPSSTPPTITANEGLGFVHHCCGDCGS